MKWFVLALLVGCGSSGGGGDDGVNDDAGGGDSQGSADAAIDASMTFTLTSPSLTEGGVIAETFSCNGADTSPALAWTNPPAGTLSFAIVFRDVTFPLIHSIIYDIPANVTSLPAGVEKVYAPTNVAGAHQTTAFDNTTRGYRGPCPGEMHTYEFAIYAINAAALPGATMSTTRAAANTAIQANNLGKATLSGTYTPP